MGRSRAYRGENSEAWKTRNKRIPLDDFVALIVECMHCDEPLPTANDKHVVFLNGDTSMPWVFCLPCWKLLQPHHDMPWVMKFLKECTVPKANEPSATDGTAPGTPPTNETDR